VSEHARTCVHVVGDEGGGGATAREELLVDADLLIYLIYLGPFPMQLLIVSIVALIVQRLFVAMDFRITLHQARCETVAPFAKVAL
jgi:hypothetical protein